jgi:hypothetical protein
VEAKQFDELKRILGDLPKKLADTLGKSSAAVRGPAGEGVLPRPSLGGGARAVPGQAPMPGDRLPPPAFLEGVSRFGPPGPMADIATILGAILSKKVPMPAPVLPPGPLSLKPLGRLPAPVGEILRPLEPREFPESMKGDLGLKPLEGRERPLPIPSLRPVDRPTPSVLPEGDIGLRPLTPTPGMLPPAPSVPIPRPTGGPASVLGPERLEPRLPAVPGSPLGAPQHLLPRPGMSMAGGSTFPVAGAQGQNAPLVEALKDVAEAVKKLDGRMERAERNAGREAAPTSAAPAGGRGLTSTVPRFGQTVLTQRQPDQNRAHQDMREAFRGGIGRAVEANNRE